MVRALVVLMVMVACGGNDKPNSSVDAAPAPDTPIDGAGTPVTVTVTDRGAPFVGGTVYFVNADDSLAAKLTTDAQGVASAVVTTGGSVTVAGVFADGDSPDDAPALVSYLGLVPGDHLTLPRPARPADVELTLKIPAVATATRYEVITTCGDSSFAGVVDGDTVTGQITIACGNLADIAIIATRRVGATTVPLSGLYHAGASLSNGGTLNLTADTFGPLQEIRFVYSNWPVTDLDVDYALLTEHGSLGPFDLTFAGDMISALVPMVPGARSVVSSRPGQLHSVTEWGPLTSPYTLDVTSVLLPELFETPAFDVATMRVTWNQAATGAEPDSTFAVVVVDRPAPGKSFLWQVFAPYTKGIVQLPKVPDWTPVVGDTTLVGILGTIKLPGGYPALHTLLIDTPDRELPVKLGGASGRVVSVKLEHI